MEFYILFFSLVLFVVSTLLYSVFKNPLQNKKTLKSSLEIVMGASLASSIFFLIV